MERTGKKKRKTFTRRDFLKSLGGGAVGVGVASKVLGKEPVLPQAGPGDPEIFSRKIISLTVNGKSLSLEVDANETLLQVLRDKLKLTGTKKTCNRGECGGCTVLLNGTPVYSCHMLALQADGGEILSVEGLAKGDKLHPVQQAFIDKDAYQCGFCTPGFIMASVALLNKTKTPSPEDIRAALAGNLCRCGNYQKIYEAVSSASETMRRA
jgi:aerobic-type carbon monoxide dehydrogenase small subunit (CoxS/CutS family)